MAKSRVLPGAAADWREETLARMRTLIMQADPGMIEERKWIKPTNPAGVPVWSHNGMVCTGEKYKNVVKLTFAYGKGRGRPERSRRKEETVDLSHPARVPAPAHTMIMTSAGASTPTSTNTRPS